MSVKWNQKSFIHRIEDDLIKFILNENKICFYPVPNRIVMEKAGELCPAFLVKETNTKQCFIKRFMRKWQLKLPPPPRKASKLPHLNKVYLCQGVKCDVTCRRRDNCPIKCIIRYSYKKVSVIPSVKKGKCLFIQEKCKENEFVIEYIEKCVSIKKGGYLWKVGKNHYIDGNTWQSISIILVIQIVREIVSVDGKLHACLFTSKFIWRGIELVFDYKWDKKLTGESTAWYCGSVACRGSIEKI
jgi:hypothetical protein